MHNAVLPASARPNTVTRKTLPVLFGAPFPFFFFLPMIDRWGGDRWCGSTIKSKPSKSFFFVLNTNFVRPVSNKYGAGRGKGQFEFTFLDVEVTAITRVSALVSAIIYYVPVWLLE